MEWTKEAAITRMKENQELQQLYQRYPLTQLLVESATKLNGYPNYNRVSCYYAYKDWMWAATGHVDNIDGWICMKVIDDLLPPDSCDLELEEVPSISSNNPPLPGLPPLPKKEYASAVYNNGTEKGKYKLLSFSELQIEAICDKKDERRTGMKDILEVLLAANVMANLDPHSDSTMHAKATFLTNDDLEPDNDWAYTFGANPVILQIEGGYGGCCGEDFEGRKIFLDPKQARSLLKYLQSNEEFLKQNS